MLSNKAKGYAFGAIAASTYGLNPLFALPLYGDGLNADSVLFLRYLCAIPVLAIMIRARGRSFAIKKEQIVPLMALGLMMALSSLLLFQSYNYMEAGIASTLLFVYPIMVALIMAVVYKQKLGAVTIFCLALALGGIALLYEGGDGATLSGIGTAMVFASALCYALYIVGINSRRIKDLPTVKLTFYVLCFGVLLFAARLIINQDLVLPSKWYMWGNVAALAIFPTAVSLVCTTLAVQYIGSTPTAILGALEPVTAVIIGITVFGEHISGREFIGIILIILAVTLVIAGEKLPGILIRLRKMFPSKRGTRS